MADNKVETITSVKVETDTAKLSDTKDKLKDLSNETDNNSSKLKENKQAVLDNGGAVGILNELTGGLASTVKDAVEATSLFTKGTRANTIAQSAYTAVVGTGTTAMKAFRLALAATGIGAIVIAIILLIQNFDKVKEAVYKFIPGLKILGDVFTTIINAVTDFIGVTSDATRELDKMVAASEKALKKNEIFLEANGDKYDQYTQRKIKANIDYNKKVVELAKEEGRTEEEKIKLLQQFRDKANREIAKADKDREDELDKNRQAAADKAKAAADKAASEKSKRDADAKAAEDKRIAEKAAFDKAIVDAELANLIQQENDKEAVLSQLRIISAEQALSDKYLQDQAILQATNATQEEQLALATKYEEDKALLETTTRDKKLADDKAAADAQMAIDKAATDAKIANLNQVANVLGQASAALGTATAAGKVAAVAQATISTYTSAVSSYNSLSGIPIVGPVLGAVAAGLAVASGIANVKKILAVKVPGGGGGGAAAGGTPTAPPKFNIVGQSSTNQLAQTISQQQNVPVTAQVVGSQVSTQQALDRNRLNNRTFI
jgi:hypothetical protein